MSKDWNIETMKKLCLAVMNSDQSELPSLLQRCALLVGSETIRLEVVPFLTDRIAYLKDDTLLSLVKLVPLISEAETDPDSTVEFLEKLIQRETEVKYRAIETMGVLAEKSRKGGWVKRWVWKTLAGECGLELKMALIEVLEAMANVGAKLEPEFCSELFFKLIDEEELVVKTSLVKLFASQKFEPFVEQKTNLEIAQVILIEKKESLRAFLLVFLARLAPEKSIDFVQKAVGLVPSSPALVQAFMTQFYKFSPEVRSAHLSELGKSLCSLFTMTDSQVKETISRNLKMFLTQMNDVPLTETFLKHAKFALEVCSSKEQKLQLFGEILASSSILSRKQKVDLLLGYFLNLIKKENEFTTPEFLRQASKFVASIGIDLVKESLLPYLNGFSASKQQDIRFEVLRFLEVNVGDPPQPDVMVPILHFVHDSAKFISLHAIKLIAQLSKANRIIYFDILFKSWPTGENSKQRLTKLEICDAVLKNETLRKLETETYKRIVSELASDKVDAVKQKAQKIQVTANEQQTSFRVRPLKT